jgi:hypothetical protein
MELAKNMTMPVSRFLPLCRYMFRVAIFPIVIKLICLGCCSLTGFFAALVLHGCCKSNAPSAPRHVHIYIYILLFLKAVNKYVQHKNQVDYGR